MVGVGGGGGAIMVVYQRIVEMRLQTVKQTGFSRVDKAMNRTTTHSQRL